MEICHHSYYHKERHTSWNDGENQKIQVVYLSKILRSDKNKNKGQNIIVLHNQNKFYCNL